MLRFCFPLLSLLAVQSLPAQTLGADSRHQVPPSSQPADTTQVRQLQAQATSLFAADFNSPQAMAVQQQALALARQLRDVPGQAAAQLKLA